MFASLLRRHLQFYKVYFLTQHQQRKGKLVYRIADIETIGLFLLFVQIL